MMARRFWGVLVAVFLPLLAHGQITVTLTPTGSIILPPSGGTLNFDVNVVSDLPTEYPNVMFWTRAQLPNGNLYPPILFSRTFTLQPNMNVTVSLSQAVPAYAPAGTYQLIGYVGINPNQDPQFSGAFSFTKANDILEQDFELGNTGIYATMVWIDRGTFMMGSLDNDPDAMDREFPRHEVTISQGFWMGKYEVTQEQWLAVMGTWSFWFYGTPTHPAERISHNDISYDFLPAINATVPDDPWRLPTEAEWEYACRAGHDETRFWWEDDPDYSELENYAWYSGNNDPYGTKPVGYKTPNPWGLYDMHGNVWEWCSDWYGSNYYYVRTCL
ncbi:formylglycine-generating enzyme family protein [bacterium]|nr:formylglycine-generating enzyme family protein [bacterium]